jgi:polyferredoxin
MEIQFTGAKFDENGISDDCKTCTGCQTICPVDIDPRKPEALNLSGLQMSLRVGQFNGCFNCGECIDACKSIQQYKKRDGLLSFQLPWQHATEHLAHQGVEPVKETSL